MQKSFFILVCAFAMCFVNTCVKGQINSLYDQLISINSEWRNQLDIDGNIKMQNAKLLNEQQLIQLHLSETEKLLRSRDVAKLSSPQKEKRVQNLNVLHQYLTAGQFPVNTMHSSRQPYFIDDNNNYCAVGYLMKESGADDVARNIQATQNYSYLADIHHPKLMNWMKQSGLSFDELALIQPAYQGDWPSAIMEFHYNNIGTDVNEYIEIHESSNSSSGSKLTKVRFYNGSGTLYKTVLATQMQTYISNGGQAYYYVFSANENFADSGKIEIIGLDFSSNEQLLSTTTYTSHSVKVQDYNPNPNNPTVKQFNIGENEQTPINTSLTYCGFYYNSNWSLQSVATTIASQNPCTIMPIGLTRFSYAEYDNKVKLTWESSAEVNNKFFTVERSLNGVQFDAIGNVSASNIAKLYEYTDNSPNAVNHYRLKQIDADGKYTYSKILYVKVEKVSPLLIMQNLVSSNLQYQVSSAINVGSTLQILDFTGRSIYHTNVKSGVQQVDVSHWSSGKYVIQLQALNGQVYSQQFVKQ